MIDDFKYYHVKYNNLINRFKKNKNTKVNDDFEI